MKRHLGWVVGALCVTGSGLTTAADESVLDRMRACAIETNAAVRLTCYDTAIGRMRPGSGDDVGVTGELLRNQRKEAGLAQPAPQRIEAKVVAVTRPASGKMIVTLDNGQVWSQQELLEFPIEVGDGVAIQPGLLGALWMVDAHRHRQTRVSRIQ